MSDALDPSAKWKTIAVLAICAVLAVGFTLERAGLFRGAGTQARQAPDVVFKDHAGTNVRLSGYQGKYVLLNFWATWCPPCIDEVPSLERLAARLKQTRPDIVVLAPSLDQDGWKAIDPFLAQMQVTAFDVVRDDRAAARSFGTYKLPETWLIGPHGEILNPPGGIPGATFRSSRFVGPQRWDDPRLISWFEALPR